ncbi:MAG: polyisoprenoid-binding protein [Planctomycetes bacterium]|nr:polyisoprenoid-binding protein [Planctomycetota bacterium]
MRRITLLFLVAAISTPVLAKPETYAIDNTHTYPRFSYSHFGFSTQLSRFNKTSGDIIIDREAKLGSMNIIIATPSVDTGYPLFDEHIQGKDFLDTAKYPTASFTSNKVNFDGEKIASVDGILTLKGISNPVTLNVTSFQCMQHPMLKKDACGANASAVIKRTDFNMGKYAPNVSDEVTLSIAVEAVKN